MKSQPSKLLIATLAVAWLAGLFLMDSLESALHGTTTVLGIDLYPRWVGTQAALRGDSPYSMETRQMIWQAIYGNPDVPDGNPFGFYYPPGIITLLAPLVALQLPIQTAAVLWCALLWALLSVFLVLWIMDFSRLTKARLMIPLLLLTGWFFRPAFSNYILGQFALFSVLLAVAAWIAFEREKPVLAGILCTLSLIKPSLTILPIVLLLFLHRRERAGLVSFLVSSAILYLPPTLILGWWPPDFLRDISGYALENQVAWSSMDMKSLPGVIWLVLSILLIAIGLGEKGEKDEALSLSSALALNTIFVPHTADYDLVAFIPLLVYVGYRWLFHPRYHVLLTIVFFSLWWFPWLTLIYFLVSQLGSPHTVETWYRFIWWTYPLLVLSSAFLTKLPLVKSNLIWMNRRLGLYQGS